jgi:hypothetical protein
MDPGQAMFGQETACAAAEGTEQAAAAIAAAATAAAASASTSRAGPGGGARNDDIRLRMMPRIYDYVTAGVSKPSGGGAGGGLEGKHRGTSDVDGGKDRDAGAPAGKEQSAAAARAVALLHHFSAGGWAMTAHEIVQAAAIERGDSTAPGLTDWRASRQGGSSSTPNPKP